MYLVLLGKYQIIKMEKKLQTHFTNKALGMPLSAHGTDKPIHNSITTGFATRGKQFIIIFRAVGFPFVFMETVPSKGFPTLSAEEMLRMPGVVKSSHNLL